MGARLLGRSSLYAFIQFRVQIFHPRVPIPLSNKPFKDSAFRKELMSAFFWYLIDNVKEEKTPDPVTLESTYPAKYPESRV